MHVGGGSLICTNSGGAPFVSDLERGRREGTLADHDEIVRLTHAADGLALVQSGGTEASELSELSRHLEHDYSVMRWSDKPFVCYGTSGPKAQDAIELAAIAYGGHAALAAEPAILGIVNPNSPLVWDELMVDALTAWASARQPVLVTPFLLAGATAPVSVAGGLALQIAEALSGVALVQLTSPGAPVVFGSFFSAIDMRSGGPRSARPSSCSRRSRAASWRVATACRSVAAAASARRTRSMRRPPTRRPCRCGRRSWRGATS